MPLSNLPPGVSESDIPGNRPEDIEAERLHEQFCALPLHQMLDRLELRGLEGEFLERLGRFVCEHGPAMNAATVIEFVTGWTWDYYGLELLREIMGADEPANFDEGGDDGD